MEASQSIAYPAQSRLVRASRLNTITEERDTTIRSDSEGDASDTTIRARPRHPNIDAVLAFVKAQAAHIPEDPYHCPSPAASDCGRPVSVAGSDVGTVFSEASCPSLDSEPTTFHTLSSRNSVTSGKSHRSRYSALPALYIPQESSWASAEIPIKAIDIEIYDMPTKSQEAAINHRLSIQNLAALSHSYAPAGPVQSSAPPSLDDASSQCSVPIKCPPTPELPSQDSPTDCVYEITLDESNVVMVSPTSVDEHSSEIHSSHLSPHEWSDMVQHFPHVPGATPQAHSPLMPSLEELSIYKSPCVEDGMLLPMAAWQTLNKLTMPQSPHPSSLSSGSAQPQMEMRQRTPQPQKTTPKPAQLSPGLSDCFTPLSPPAITDFFTTVQDRPDDWIIRETLEPYSSDVEKFYDLPWPRSEAGQQVFIPEDEDMYGSGDEAKKVAARTEGRQEYEETYERELRQAAGANLDRTGSWLANQDSYFSGLLDVSADDLDEAPSELIFEAQDKDVSPPPAKIMTPSVQVKAAVATSDTPAAVVGQSPGKKRKVKTTTKSSEPILNEAFQYLASVAKPADARRYASPRVQALRAERLASPEKYVDRLLGHHNLQTPARPKYSGPFGQNPKHHEEKSDESTMFKTVERQQAALALIQESHWQIEALRSLFKGRLFASEAAHRYLKRRSKNSKGVKKPTRILDLGGSGDASWGWHAAEEFPTSKVFTVLTTDSKPEKETDFVGPTNHHKIKVPALWRLPFSDNRFDVISVRNLHALLKSNPIPDLPQVNEWDMTLRECQRVLKPGGFLDFMVMDSSITNPGPKSEAICTEFGFDLRRRGYEKEAAKSWLPRLKTNGFADVKRTWMFLPMGKNAFYTSPSASQAFVPAPRPVSEVSCISQILRQYMDVEAVRGPVGSTQAIADLTGLVGTRMWEQWISKVRLESGRSHDALLEGVDAVLEEGRELGSGWKVLVGWARKQRQVKPAMIQCPNTIFIPTEECTGFSPVVDSPADGLTLPFMLDHASLMAQVEEYRLQYEKDLGVSVQVS